MTTTPPQAPTTEAIDLVDPAQPDPAQPDAGEQAAPTATRRRRLPLTAALAAASLMVSGGAYAVTSAHKSVTLDVDGRLTTVDTFAGSVEKLLTAQGVRLTERDLVSPAVDAPLKDGADVVVRFGREITVSTDGTEATTWVTVLDAHEALAALTARGADVALVASRSGERASLALRLDADAPVAVVADDATTVVDGQATLDKVLEAAKVTVDADDTVRVVTLADAGVPAKDAPGAEVAVVVERVVVQEVTTEHAIEFETQTTQDDTQYEGESQVAQEGANGVRTVVEEVVTVDGEETERTLISDEVTTEPVPRIIAEGTKEVPAPQPAPASSSGGSTGPVMSGSPRAIGQELAAQRGWAGEQWQCLDQLFAKESGWNPSAQNPSSGAYGIPQSLPGSKMASVADDWRTNPATQITWGLNYIEGRYGTPCGAWGHSQSVGWY